MQEANNLLEVSQGSARGSRVGITFIMNETVCHDFSFERRQGERESILYLCSCTR